MAVCLGLVPAGRAPFRLSFSHAFCRRGRSFEFTARAILALAQAGLCAALLGDEMSDKANNVPVASSPVVKREELMVTPDTSNTRGRSPALLPTVRE